MSVFLPTFSFKKVVLIADEIDLGDDVLPLHNRRDLEMTDCETLETLSSTIENLGLMVQRYNGPSELAMHAASHSNDIILSIYGGKSSRNRMALVPAICETFGLRFIGPDVYGRIIAQDKEITKRLALDCGLATPAWRIVRNIYELGYLEKFPFPAVVKPLMEGSSIGIAQRNLVTNYKDLSNIINELLVSFNQPVIVEEFVAGREVAYSKIEYAGSEGWAFSEVVIDGKPDYFSCHLFDADEKQTPTKGRTVKNIDHELAEKDRLAIETLLTTFGPYGYCRVDGRFSEGRFHFIELTPDAWIAPRGQFAKGFTDKGWNYEQVIAKVLGSAG